MSYEEENEKRFRVYLVQPQNWNRYSYVINNPVALIDPDGREGGYAYGFTTTQNYDLAGHDKTKTSPSGRSVAYEFDAAGDLSSLTGNIGDGAARTNQRWT